MSRRKPGRRDCFLSRRSPSQKSEIFDSPAGPAPRSHQEEDARSGCVLTVRSLDSIHTPYGMRLESKGLSHGLKMCRRHIFLTAFRVLSRTKKEDARSGHNSPSKNFRSHPHPYRMRLGTERLSHELNQCPPDTCLHQSADWCRSFESFLAPQKRTPLGVLFFGARDGTRTHTA